ncbi:MAG TPA: FtsH protease activity modulator HflK [Clostridiaceae bacterium]|jgi:membrane protease subunit HflK|nr:FtsH protease activity modulator HflK [Clostridiaceae bacterium]
MKKITGAVALLVALVIAGIWFASGFYTVQSGEQAVVLRFGKYIDTITEAGLNWHMPYPIDQVEILNVVEPRRIEIGFITVDEGGFNRSPSYKDNPQQSMMITGDENLVDVETVVQYRIKDIKDYLFNVRDQNKTLLAAAESAIRRVVANHILDEVLTDNKSGIQSEIKADLQEICDSYNMGITITAVQFQDVSAPEEVDDAFKDVTNAREDKNSYINEAESYANEVLPKARGNAAQIINEAEAYKEKRIAEARGDVANFVQILERYKMGEEVTRTRMYLEMMEKILPGLNKYIVDGDSGTIKFLPLESLKNQ